MGKPRAKENANAGLASKQAKSDVNEDAQTVVQTKESTEATSTHLSIKHVDLQSNIFEIVKVPRNKTSHV